MPTTDATPATREFRVAYFDRPAHHLFTDILSGTPGITLLHLDSKAPVAQTLAQLASCQGLALSAARSDLPPHWYVNASLLAALPGLWLVASYGAGYDTIDVDACSAAGVLAANQAGGNAHGVAEHALAMMMALLKRIPEAHAVLRSTGVGHRDTMLGRELGGRSVGIVGLGHTGTRLARLLQAFDCTVLACDPYLDAATCLERGARKLDLAELLRNSDVVSLHCPLLDSTRGMFDAAAFGRMRDGAIFVTTARGLVHDEAALLAALEAGKIAGAGLDVWADEPPASTNPLVQHARVLASPHTAGVTQESRARVGRMAAEVFTEAALGRLPPRLLNPHIAAEVSLRLGLKG